MKEKDYIKIMFNSLTDEKQKNLLPDFMKNDKDLINNPLVESLILHFSYCILNEKHIAANRKASSYSASRKIYGDLYFISQRER